MTEVNGQVCMEISSIDIPSHCRVFRDDSIVKTYDLFQELRQLSSNTLRHFFDLVVTLTKGRCCRKVPARFNFKDSLTVGPRPDGVMQVLPTLTHGANGVA